MYPKKELFSIMSLVSKVTATEFVFVVFFLISLEYKMQLLMLVSLLLR